MARNPSCTVFIGNLDDKVSERVLYEILIQVGHVVDLYIPRDKETNCPKGYAFAQYESEEIAGYAVRLFSGLIRLHNKTLRFGISGQDKPSKNPSISATPKPNSPPTPKPYSMHARETQMSRSIVGCRVSAGTHSAPPIYPQVSVEGPINRRLSDSNVEYSRRAFGAIVSNSSRP